jgi:hypothetical protein
MAQAARATCGSFLANISAGGLFWHFIGAGGLFCQKFEEDGGEGIRLVLGLPLNDGSFSSTRVIFLPFQTTHGGQVV